MSESPSRLRCPNCRTEVLLPAGVASCPGRRRWRVGLIVLGVLLIGCLAIGYRYRGQFTTILLLTNEVTGSTPLSVAALGVAALAGLCLVGWCLLPLFLAWAYFDFRRRLGVALPGPCADAPPPPPPPPPSQPPAPS